MKPGSEPYMSGKPLSRPGLALRASRKTVPCLAVATAMMASVTLGAQAAAAAAGPVTPTGPASR